MTKLSGACLCGAVTYSGDCDIVRTVNCHCTDCQKATGAVHGTLIFVPVAQLHVRGHLRDFVHQAESGATMTKRFCPNCGSQMLGLNSNRPGAVGIRAGTLDDKSLIRPQMNIWTKSAVASSSLDPNLPAYPASPG